MKTRDGWVIYTLEDPRGGGIRYVGMTHDKPEKRLGKHLYAVSRGLTHHLQNWLRKMISEGISPTLFVVEHGSGDGWGMPNADGSHTAGASVGA